MLADETVQALREALEAVAEWKEARLQQIDDQVAFLRSADVSISRLSTAAQESATDSAAALIDSILASS